MHSGTLLITPVRRLASLLPISILAAAFGCGEETTSPTEEATPALSTASAPTLSFRQVSVGAFHTCGLTTDGRAYCWGRGSAGQLGDGARTQRLRPVAVAGGLRFVQISAGSLHSCAVTADDRAYCWGANSSGQLGNGTFTDRRTPVAVVGRRFRQVRAGHLRTCGLNLNGAAYCWGDNRYRQLGRRDVTKTSTPLLVAGGHTWIQVVPAATHTCGVTTDHRGYCWGNNSFGQLGDGTRTSSWKPVAVIGGLRFRGVFPGSAGDALISWQFHSHTCGVTTDDRAYCWGENRRNFTSTTPLPVGDGRFTFRFVVSGNQNGCGTTTSHATLCWTLDLEPVELAQGLRFNAVSKFPMGNHTCGWTVADNRAYCWGENSSGQLGDGTTTTKSTPVAVLGPM